MVNEKGREPDQQKIIVIDGLTTPTNAREIDKLLEHVGWCRDSFQITLRKPFSLLSCLGKIIGLSGQKLAKGHLRS